jgi:hypothetical protein
MSQQREPHGHSGISRRQFLGAVPAAWLATHAIARASGAHSPSLTLLSPTTRALAPFCVGQAFAKGRIPFGAGIAGDVPNLQATIKNRWPDGSVKFAIIAGRANLAANVPLVIGLYAGAPASGTPLTEADLLATGLTASIGFAPYGSVALAPLIGVASSYSAAAQRWTAGRVTEWFSGPECASWLYYAPVGSDAHLAAWFEVRLWNGGAIEILPWLENGYLRVAAPNERAGTASFQMNGQARFQLAFTLPNHSRTALLEGATLAHWRDGLAPISVRHDTDYLQATHLVPAYYGTTAAGSPAFARLTTMYTPLARGDHSPGMGSAGYHPSIGLLPEWDAAFLTSGADPRAAAAVQVNAFCAGRYGIHFRDETTNRPLAMSSYPHLVLGNGSGVSSVGSSSTNTFTPAAGGMSPPTWASSHHPSVGYLAYLITGRRYFAEEIQFAATLNYLKQTDTVRGLSAGVLRTNAGANTTRGAAWALRTLAQACTASADDDPLRGELLASLEANVRAYHADNIATPGHPQGFCVPYSDYTSGDNVFFHAAWMEDFLTAAWGYALDLDLPLPADARSQLETLFAWKCRSTIGRFGMQGAADQFNYRDAAQYTVAVAPSDTAQWVGGIGPWYANWGQIYQATTGTANTASTDTALRNGNFPEPTSYWGNLQPAMAYAVARGIPGALAAYQRMTGASNWNQILGGWDDAPVWGVKPHADTIFADGFDLSSRFAHAARQGQR